MLIPIRCFTCGKVLADKHDYYVKQVEALHHADLNPKTSEAKEKAGKGKGKAAAKKSDKGKAVESVGGSSGGATQYFDVVKTGPILDKMGLHRYCCRRHMLGTVDMMDTI